MNIDAEIKNLKENEQQPQTWATWCCCLLGNASTFCGLALVVIGGIWLLSSLGVFTAGLSLIAPLLFICLGLFWLVGTTQRRA